MADPIKVMVVDDEENFRVTLKDFLSDYEHLVTTVGDAKAALDILENENFDLIICDLRLPMMDGISFTRKVIEMGRDMPVIVMTAYASIESAVEAMKAGAADYIAKPFKLEHLLFLIDRVMETRRLRELAGQSEYYRTLSNLDDLTGIHNYRFFKDMLVHELERHTRYNRPISLLMADIDDFKQTNDTYGHLAGDQVLREIAHLIKRSVRSCDIVARYGGEEFVVILPETSEEEALKVGQRIVSTIGRHRFILAKDQVVDDISITVGLACFPRDAAEAKQLIENADQALYEGKNTGKNKVCIYSRMKN